MSELISSNRVEYSTLLSSKEAKLVYGIGINDFNGNISVKGNHIYEYRLWKSMLRRCYTKELNFNRPTYDGCQVSDDLLYFSNFYNFVRKLHGFQFTDDNGKYFTLDKDLLGCGKLYSKDTVCFIPNEVNLFMTNKKSGCSEYPIGVLFHKASGKFISQITINGKRKYLGLFNNPIDAFCAYKVEKEDQAKYLAEKYKDVIDCRAYNALISYEVNIYD